MSAAKYAFFLKTIFFCLTIGVGEPKPQFTAQEQINSNPFFPANDRTPNQYNYQNSASYYNQQPKYQERYNYTTESNDQASRYDPTSNQYYYNSGSRNNFQNVSLRTNPNDSPNINSNERIVPREEIFSLLTVIDNIGSEQCSANVYAQWEYETNVNDITQLGAVSRSILFAN